MNFKFFIVASALIGLMASCSSDDFSQDNEKAGRKTEDTNLTSFASAEISTRTSMDYNTLNFFWEKGDKIYVKDDNGGFQVSKEAVDGDKQAAFKFMMPGKYTKHIH